MYTKQGHKETVLIQKTMRLWHVWRPWQSRRYNQHETTRGCETLRLPRDNHQDDNLDFDDGDAENYEKYCY